MELLVVALIFVSYKLIELYCKNKIIGSKKAFFLCFFIVSAVFFITTFAGFVEKANETAGFTFSNFVIWLSIGFGIGVIAGVKCISNSSGYDY